MRITIDTAENGYVITSKEFTQDDSTPYDSFTAIEEDDSDESGEIKSFRSLCYTLMDKLGVQNSKHNKFRLYIEIRSEDGREL